MPYTIKKKGDKVIVKKKSTGKVVAHTTKENLHGVLWHREHGDNSSV